MSVINLKTAKSLGLTIQSEITGLYGINITCWQSPQRHGSAKCALVTPVALLPGSTWNGKHITAGIVLLMGINDSLTLFE